MLKITLVKSLIKSKPDQIGTVRALGLGKVGSVVFQAETDCIKGMIGKVGHLLSVEVVSDEEASK
ncbi:MAG: 50S ribosomal protein L30 [Abditibacteriota bacterium]|nr:50S ribosomal protein L30 [Abditibacteriota bacterium]